MKPLKKYDKPEKDTDSSKTAIELESRPVTSLLNEKEVQTMLVAVSSPGQVTTKDEEPGQLVISDYLSLKTPKEKISSLELLKIIAFLLLISQYYGMYTFPKLNDKNYLREYSHRWVFYCLIRRFGNAGWNIFMLITGYLNVTSKNGKRKAFFLLALEIVFYYYTAFPITINYLAPKYKKLVKGLNEQSTYFPILNYTNKHTDNYMLLNCFVTFMNEILTQMDKDIYFDFMVMLFLFYCILPDLTRNIYHFFVGVLFQKTDLDVLIIMYIMGSYFRIYGYKNKPFWIKTWIVIFIMYVAAEFWFQHMAINKQLADLLYYGETWENYNTLPCVLFSIGLFITFADMKFKSSIINYVAESVFGIYLLYDNFFYKEYVWYVWYPFRPGRSFIEDVFHWITKVFGIFFICLAIDIARRCTIEYVIKQILVTQWVNVKKICGAIGNCYFKMFEYLF